MSDSPSLPWFSIIVILAMLLGLVFLVLSCIEVHHHFDPVQVELSWQGVKVPDGGLR